MNLEIRRIPFTAVAASQRLVREAFGAPSPLPSEDAWPPPGARPWGAWVDGELAARATVRSFTSWFHGARVRTAGLGAVTVAAEHRGSGLLRPLLEVALDDAREQGALLSTLYPSAAGIYRGLGYEVVGSLDEVTIPLSRLAALRPPASVRLRRATAEDLGSIRDTYEAWAALQNGPLTRDEPPFEPTPAALFGPEAEHTGVSLAVDASDAGAVLGYVVWKRSAGDDAAHRLEVGDLVALTSEAALALWSLLGSFSTVVGSARLTTSGAWAGADVTRLALPDHAATTVSEPYMLRLLDVPGALGSARLAPMSVQVPFAVADPRSPDLEGSWMLRVADGAVEVVEEPGGTDPVDRPTFTARGLALSYAGSQSCPNLRLAGLLSGPDRHDAVWDALWAGRTVHVRDHF